MRMVLVTVIVTVAYHLLTSVVIPPAGLNYTGPRFNRRNYDRLARHAIRTGTVEFYYIFALSSRETIYRYK